LCDYYNVVKILGRGGFGTVVEAFDKYKNEKVAIKVRIKAYQISVDSEKK